MRREGYDRWVTLGTIAALMFVAGALAGCIEANEPNTGDAADVPNSPEEVEGEERPVDEELAEVGQWLDPVDTEEAAIHAVMLPDGRILLWSGLESHGGDGSPFLSSPPNGESRVMDVWDPRLPLTTPEPADGGASDLFCVGQALLPDGRVLATGGTRWETVPDTFIYGTDDVRTYDPETNTWEQQPDMAYERWYPSTLVLPDGRALIAAGIEKVDDPDTMIEQMEVFDPETDTIEELPPSADRDLPMYPRLYVVPSGPLEGEVFYQPAGCLWCPGGNSDGEAQWDWAASFDPETNEWTTLEQAVFGARNAPVTAMLKLEAPDYEARILSSTGTLDRSAAASATSEITDLSSDPPTHETAAPINNPRWFANHVTLPDGSVVTVGGAKHDGVLFPGTDQNPVSPVMEVEIFHPDREDPVTGLPGQWVEGPPIENPRVYHSTALLMPDGRVWVAGSVPAQTSTPAEERHHETTVEIYEPPYLFRGDRPAIAGAPDRVGWDETFDIATPDAEGIEEAVLVRAGSTTHVYNAEQRVIELPIEHRSSSELTVTAPPNENVAPPGTYMLFVMQGTELGPVPSKAAMVQVPDDPSQAVE